MKLIAMCVANFRSIKGEQTTISFENSDIIFLIGQNNVGKSSFLTAYEYLVTPKQVANQSDFNNFCKDLPIKIFAEFQKEPGDEKEFSSKGFDKWVDSNGKIRFCKEWTTPGIEGLKKTFDPSTNDYVDNGFGGLEAHFTKQAPTAIRIPALPTLDDLTKWVKAVIQKTVLKQLSTDETKEYQKIVARIQELKSRLTSREAIKLLEDKANLNFKKVFPELLLKIAAIDGEIFDLSKVLESEFAVTVNDPNCPDINQDFKNLGHGAIRQVMFNFLGIVKNNLPTETKTEKKEYLILFEEPEIYLHPKAIAALKDVLYGLVEDSPFQILIASHSPMIVDVSKPHTSIVRIEKNSDRNTAIYQVNHNLFETADEKKNMVQMINRFDPAVCTVFYANEVILVEGDTEAIICRNILKKEFPDKDIYVLNTGSKNNMPFFQVILTHFNIKHHVIHDSDYRHVYSIDKSSGNRVYSPILKKDGTKRQNSAWKLNATIWDTIVDSNSKRKNIAYRYVSIYDFETANGYEYDVEKGKPLSAFEYSQNEELIKNSCIYNMLLQIVERVPKQDYSQEELERKIKEPV